MKRDFNITEILESVDILVDSNLDKANDKNKIISNYKEFTNTNIDVSVNPKTEKIIIDAEKSLKYRVAETNNKKTKQSALILNGKRSSNLDLSEPLILEKYFIEEENSLVDEDLEEIIIDDENNIKELENNYIYESKMLKSENIKQQEKIKDLNILLDDFNKQKRYSDLNDKINLYQEDNNALRKKLFKLNELETRLRLQLSELKMDKQIDEDNEVMNKRIEEK